MAVTLNPEQDVLPAVETFMTLRTRSAASWGSSVQGPQGDRLLGHFSDGDGSEPATRPTRAEALQVTARMAVIVGRAYPSAVEADSPELVEHAALMAAVRLETMFYADEVESGRSPARVWMELLESATTQLNERLGAPSRENPAEGDVGLRVAGSFRGSGGGGVRVEGAEGSMWPGSAFPWPYRSPADLDALVLALGG